VHHPSRRSRVRRHLPALALALSVAGGSLAENPDPKQEAQQLIEKAVEEAKKIENEGDRTRALGAIVSAQAVSGDIDGARKAAGERRRLLAFITAEEANQRTESASKEARELAAAGNFLAALKLAAAADPHDGWRNEAIADFTSRLINSKREDLKEAIEAAGKIRDLYARRKAIEAMALGIAKADPFDAEAAQGALDLILEPRKQNEAFYRARALARMAAVLAEKGKRGEAEDLLRQAEPLGGDRCIEEIAVAQTKIGDLATARKNFLKALKAYEAEGHGFEMNIGLVAGAQADAGDIEGALKTAAAIPAGQESAYRHVAEAQAAAGDFRGALGTVGRLPPGEFTEATLCGIARRQMEARDLQGALSTMDLIREPTSILSSTMKKAGTLAAIAMAQAKAKETEASRATLRRAIETAHTFSGDMVKAHSLWWIAWEQAKAGDSAGVALWASEEPAPFLRSITFSAAAHGLFGATPRAPLPFAF